MSEAGLSSGFARLRKVVLATASAAALLMAAASAVAAAPVDGSLPGGFSSNQAGVTYGGSGTAATITTGSGNVVLQWGGSALSNPVSAPGGLSVATNPGFSIGKTAALAISNGNAVTASSVLVNDLTGSPTEIYGTLDASGIGGGPLYVANANGITVGPTGIITAPTAGIGLIAYQIPSDPYNGTVNIAPGTPGSYVKVQSGATINSRYILAAGANSVNLSLSHICTGNCSVSTYAIAGGSFKTNPGSVKPVLPPPPKFHFHW
ncbi:MAG TPA: hypothetical protein VEH07_01945 [Alphaproteobacteria bacterium]|nr:hypothetical protein [Alphaproteobacteria bacterium]